MKKALVNGGKVVNAVDVPDDWTGGNPGDWVAPPGLGVVDIGDANAGPGDNYNKTTEEFSKPVKVKPQEKATVEQLLTGLNEKLSTLETKFSTLEADVAGLKQP